MAYDGWLEYNGVELVNLSRTAQLAEVLGLDAVWTTVDSTQWIEDALDGVGYGQVVNAPWYDPGYPASSEFGGVVPLGLTGLDDSTLTAPVQEFTSDGGSTGRARNGSLTIVANMTLVASTQRGAEFGKRWLDRVLRGSSDLPGSGVTLRYFRYPSEDSPVAHRRAVRVTRGGTLARKNKGDSTVLWSTTFTLTANDSYEYGEPVASLAGLGGVPTGQVLTSGSTVLTEQPCPVYDYSPIYDPLFPALVPSPSAPNFYPDSWDIVAGMTFNRYWATVPPVEPAVLRCVPVITLTSDEEARMVRVSVWGSDASISDQCDPLFTAIVAYLPAGQQFIIDGERKVAYVWDGFSPSVRRADSLVFGPDASPVEWSSFTDPTSLRVTLDLFSDSDGYEGDGTVRAAVSLVPKSD